MKKNMKSLELQIAEPCNENWHEMTPIRGGNFCASCEKTVVDFTEMTDRELVNFYERYDGKICGRFRSDQLDRQIAFPSPPSRIQKWKTIAALISGLLLGGEVNAQNDQPMTAIHQVDQEQKTSQAKAIFLEGLLQNEEGEPLIAATIQLLSKGVFQAGAVSDFDGKFKIKRPSQLSEAVLKISYIGYTTKEFSINTTDFDSGKLMKLKLEGGVDIEEIVVVGYGVKQTRHTLMGSVAMSVSPIKKHKKTAKPKDIIVDPKIKLYPNPFVDQINVDLTIEEEGHYLFQLYTSTGQLILAETKVLELGKQEESLTLKRELPSATYIFVITRNNQNVHTQQIVKMD